MDQRREPRFEADQPVVVTVLTEPQVRMVGRVRNASGRGLGLIVPEPVAPGAPIKIEIEDALVLGEAIYCRAETDAHFIGVELDQMLVGLTELGRMLSAFDPEVPMAPVESPQG
jgi:PilZ domain